MKTDLGWYVLNDNVMGGRSEGRIEERTDRIVFTGSTNTNGGGFSSIRTQALELDLADRAGIRLRVKGDGRCYTWRLSTDARFQGRPLAYRADFPAPAGKWQSIDLPFSGFVPMFRGRQLDGPPLDSSRISGMGLMIYDGSDGPFELQLAGIGAYSNDKDQEAAEIY